MALVAQTRSGLTQIFSPYTRLPEEEKEYDRATVVATLKAMLALGYRILPPEE